MRPELLCINSVRVTMAVWINRILSLLVAGVYAWVVLSARVLPPWWLYAMVGLGLGLIWFDTGYFTAAGIFTAGNSEPMPGCVGKLIGWIILLLPLVMGLAAYYFDAAARR